MAPPDWPGLAPELVAICQGLTRAVSRHVSRPRIGRTTRGVSRFASVGVVRIGEDAHLWDVQTAQFVFRETRLPTNLWVNQSVPVVIAPT